MRFLTYFEITIFVAGLFFYLIGAHNIDISYNMGYFDDWEYDLSIGGERLSSGEIYMRGTTQNLIGSLLFTFAFFLSLINKIQNNKTNKSLNPK